MQTITESSRARLGQLVPPIPPWFSSPMALFKQERLRHLRGSFDSNQNVLQRDYPRGSLRVTPRNKWTFSVQIPCVSFLHDAYSKCSTPSILHKAINIQCIWSFGNSSSASGTGSPLNKPVMVLSISTEISFQLQSPLPVITTIGQSCLVPCRRLVAHQSLIKIPFTSMKQRAG